MDIMIYGTIFSLSLQTNTPQHHAPIHSFSCTLWVPQGTHAWACLFLKLLQPDVKTFVLPLYSHKVQCIGFFSSSYLNHGNKVPHSCLNFLSVFSVVFFSCSDGADSFKLNDSVCWFTSARGFFFGRHDSNVFTQIQNNWNETWKSAIVCENTTKTQRETTLRAWVMPYSFSVPFLGAHRCVLIQPSRM